MAVVHFMLPSQARFLEPFSSPCSSLGAVSQGICGSFHCPKFLSVNSSDGLCRYRAFFYSVGVIDYGVRNGTPVNRYSFLRSDGQLRDTGRGVFPTEGRKTSLNRRFSVSHPSRIGSSWSVKSRASLGGDGDVDIYGHSIAEDYYSVLGLTPDATPDEIKKAYYSCMKACHPDLSGNTQSGNEFCMFVNEVYEVLSDPEQRMIYDEINGYTLTATNPFKDTTVERDHAFVDEFTCIGCKNCAHTDPVTFEIEENFGRARVASQCGNPVLVEMAIQTCPVDCIYWVTAPQLTLLEDEMRVIERVNGVMLDVYNDWDDNPMVGMMLSGMGYQSPDVFTQASWKWDKRQAKAVERARVRMMKDGGEKNAWWNVQWGSTADEKKSKAATDTYARERAAKAAAAARRWREYSREGIDRRAIRNLPSAATAASNVGDEEAAEKEKAGAK